VQRFTTSTPMGFVRSFSCLAWFQGSALEPTARKALPYVPRRDHEEAGRESARPVFRTRIGATSIQDENRRDQYSGRESARPVLLKVDLLSPLSPRLKIK